MIGVQIAIQTRCLAQPLRQALQTAGRLGADGVQIDLRHELAVAELSDTGIRQLRKILDDLRLRVGSVAFPTRRSYGNSDQLERRIESTVAAMHGAGRLGCRVIVLALGSCPAPESDERATLLEALGTLAVHGRRLGVEIALQSTAPAEDLQNLLGELPEGAIGLDLNPADLVLAGQSPREFADRLGWHVVHLAANDAVRGFGSSGGEVELGRGAADFPELLGRLEEYGYRGWATIEHRQSRNPVADVETALRFLRSL